jgi:hypothetical protein
VRSGKNSKDEENESNLSFLAQTVQKWWPISQKLPHFNHFSLNSLFVFVDSKNFLIFSDSVMILVHRTEKLKKVKNCEFVIGVSTTICCNF